MRRLALHLGFWLFYMLLQGYLGAELSNPSYIDESFGFRVSKVLFSELFVLPIIIATTYFFLYYIYPSYEKKGASIFQVVASSLFAMLIASLLYRLVLSFGIRPIVYDSEPLTNPFVAARVLWTMFDLLAIVGIALSIKIFRERNKQQLVRQALIQEKLETELKFLKAQLNPHFLFNTMNNIYGLARKKSDLTPQAILRLSKIMRYMIYECAADKVLLTKELEILSDYIELEKLRYGDRLTVTFAKSITKEGGTILPLIMLSIVENAFKHGVSEARSDLEINIDVVVTKKQLQFSVLNTKDDDQIECGNGIGLKNIRRQLDLTYQDRYHLTTLAKPDQYETELKLFFYE